MADRVARRRQLGEEMETRRDELGKHWRQVAADGGISYETVRAVRKGVGHIPAPTRRAIERGLEWPARYVDELLAGRPALPELPRFEPGSREFWEYVVRTLPPAEVRKLVDAARRALERASKATSRSDAG